jgi:O-antigen ligase
VGLILPLVLLLAVVVRNVALSSLSWSLGRSALCAFGAWIVLNLLLHYGGLGELGPTTLSPSADASTLLAGLTLALAVSWLNIPRGLLFLVTGLAIAAAAVVTIVSGSPDAVLLGLNRNYLGFVMAIGIALGCTALNRRSAVVWLPLLAAMIWALIILQSRGAIIAAGSGAALAGLMRLSRQFGPKLMPVGLTILVLFVGGIAASPKLSQAVQFGRSESDLASSDAARFATTDLAIATTIANPVLGIGYGRFPIVADHDARLNFFINTHNDFLRLAAELGLPGLGLFLVLVYLSVTGLRRSGEWAGLVLMATYLVGLLFANTLSNLAVTAPFWICLGLGLGAQSLPTREALPGSNDPQRLSAARRLR